jgi:exosome complex component CSL4
MTRMSRHLLLMKSHLQRDEVNTTMNSDTVLPGQYITPAYKVDEAGKVQRYYPSKGTTISQISVNPEDPDSRKVPVLVATTLGRVVIKEIESDASDDADVTNGDVPSDTATANSDAPGVAKRSTSSTSSTNITKFLVTVFSSNTYIDYEKEFKIIKEASASTSINLPMEHDVVLVRVTKITARQANCEILTVEGFGNVLVDSGVGSNGESAHASVAYGGGTQAFHNPQVAASSHSTLLGASANDLGDSFRGIIRSQDVRSTDRDKVKIIDSFRPGDIVRAVVISLGDGSNYYLSTARNDLGVLFAKSEGGAGDVMMAVDWETMVGSGGVVEKRKCANPV